MNKNREKLLTLHGLQGNANLDVQQLSQLTGVSYDALDCVFYRGVGKQGDDPFSIKKKKPPKKEGAVAGVKAGMNRVYAFLTKVGSEKGYDAGADRDVAERFGLVKSALETKPVEADTGSTTGSGSVSSKFTYTSTTLLPQQADLQ